MKNLQKAERTAKYQCIELQLLLLRLIYTVIIINNTTINI